jgi:hypothetical protein
MTIAPSAAPSAVQQRGAAGALVLRRPDRVELAARRIDRRFGGAEAEPRQEQHHPAGGSRGDGLEEAPADGRASDDDARFELVREHAARDLHEGVGPDERAEDQTLHRRIEIELIRDQRHRHRERGAIDVVDRNQAQHQEEDPW